ncbi:MAG: hypothetical protein ABH863_05835 [Candidatus Micrarchaeota archaeon]
MEHKHVPKNVGVIRHHFINAKIATLITFFFVLLSFAMFSSYFVSNLIPKDYFVSFYALVVIALCTIYLKTVH